MNQTFTRNFQCAYNLISYPFDTQPCFIDMAISELDKPTLTLCPKSLRMEQDAGTTTLFTMMRQTLDFKNKSAKDEGLRMTITMRREITSELMSTYLPTIFLLIITYATTFFKPHFFEAALTVNLTNMLVMTTIFASVMEKLPFTSYPKMIDIWLIICQLVPFAEVVICPNKICS